MWRVFSGRSLQPYLSETNGELFNDGRLSIRGLSWTDREYALLALSQTISSRLISALRSYTITSVMVPKGKIGQWGAVITRKVFPDSMCVLS